ncbi:MAG: efflux RND transporter periplasmic adaptor subunit [Flavobacteriales bacterium]
MSKTWKLIIAIGGGFLLLVILIIVFSGGKEAKVVTLEKAEKRSIVETVTASGKLQPEVEVKIQSEVSGQIIELPVKEGDIVEKGQLLLKINPDIYISALNRADAALSSAKANLAGSKARLAQAEAQFEAQKLNFERQQKLFDQKAISKAEYDNAVSQFQTSQAEVTASKESIHAAQFSIESAMASRNEAADNLKRTTIFAPMNGTVTALTKEIGETVLGNNMMSGDVVMKVSSLSTMEVNVEVNESDIVRVQLGDTATVEVDSYRDMAFKGLVTEIGNTALNALSGISLSSNEVTNFSVKIRILASSYQELMKDKGEGFAPFKPGMSATVEIQTEKEMDVLSVPIKAVTAREDTSSTQGFGEMKMMSSNSNDNKDPFIIVFVKNASSKAEIRVVETGIQDDEFIQIKSGLSEGDEVITGPYDEVSKRLKGGDVVKSEEEKGPKK